MSADLYKALEESRHFSFKDQITRSALSIASNIAEGYERDTPADRVKFLTYAKGSCGEVRTQLYIGMEAGILPRDTARAWIEETRRLSPCWTASYKHGARNPERPDNRILGPGPGAL